MVTTTDTPRTITVEEASRLLGIGRGHAYELARRGELPGVIRLGRRCVVSRAAIERVLDDPQPDIRDSQQSS
jgi:excisionase family DNA binding protein